MSEAPTPEPLQPDLPTPAQVLIVEDELEHAEVMSDALRKPGHVCTLVSTVDAAVEELRGGAFDIVVSDLRMPTSAGQGEGVGQNTTPVGDDGATAGFKVLDAARQLQPEAARVLVTAHGDVSTTIRALREFEAFDFIEKPLDLAVFREKINRAAEHVLLWKDSAGGAGVVEADGFAGIVAGSEAMRKILDTVRRVSASRLPVLVTGESGTGKELIARAIHDNSSRSKGRYVAFNCAGQSESLIEDQLFGHVRGAFTGADRDREGVFEYADGGTLFLDEIGDMPLTMQSKLLRVLESGEVVRLGSNAQKHVDVRFVSATNQDLEKMISEGTFREDLFFRIGGGGEVIRLPPLRERRDDITRIVHHAVARYAQEQGVEPPPVSDAAMMRLASADWPGNVRQLLNATQHMVVMASSRAAGEPIAVEDVPESVRAADADREPTGGNLAGSSLQQIEKRAIRETLRLTGGNRERAAKMLGIGERTLYRKLNEYGLR
ncbi:MAG: sigma-54 dependent transcriptional regulator [Planctomycetota bacterium]